MLDNIKAIAESLHKDMIDFAKRLVQAPSITGEEKDVADLILAEMKKLDYDEAFRDTVGNVVGIIRGEGGGEHVMFNFHMDQVSPGNLDDWQYSPYDGVIADGFLHGRGASDVKGGMATQVYAAACIKKAGIKTKGDIIVTGVVEEEPGDMWGMRRLADEVLKDYPGKIGLAVLAEATGLDIYLGHRGRAEIELSTFGQIGHSSAPWRAVNAVYEMRPIIGAIEAMAENLPSDDFLGKSSICITNIECSPGWGSIVPDKCTIYIDRRFLPSENQQTIIEEMRQVIAQCAKGTGLRASCELRKLAHCSYTGVEETVDLYKPSFLTPKDDEHVVKAIKGLSRVGQEPSFGRWDFGTDGSWTAVELNIPTIGYSPGEEVYAHTTKDRVSLELMKKGLEGSIAIALEITK